MAFTIPDAGEGDNDIQSILFQEYIDVLVAGLQGVDCVLSGCAVTGGSDMTPEVAKGAVLSNGTMYAIAAGTVTIDTADATNPRIDLVVVNSSGSLAVRKGTAAAAPKPPARTANDVVLASVYVPANDTAIATTQITDLRVIRQQSPTLIAKSTTAAATNTTAAAFTILSVSVPNGLFLSGKILRVRIWGNYLSNSGSPTWTFSIAYGGTTMFADTTGATTADTDRGAWAIEFDLVAQGNSDQSLNGWIAFQTPGAKTAPTSGTAGDLAVTTSVVTPITGAAAVDSDAANRTLLVQGTMSVSNASVETVVEGYTVELIG